jgi:hypothetical protein
MIESSYNLYAAISGTAPPEQSQLHTLWKGNNPVDKESNLQQLSPSE